MQLYLGDCLDVLRTLPDNSVDSVVTDPPYGLSFMGRKWDYDVPSVEIWAECLRVLKPGGHLLAFAGTRTQHRMCVRIEDAGFEIRDMIAWIYGSGFPKSLDVSKAIDKAAGAEREVVGFDEQKAKQQTRAVGTNSYGDYAGSAGQVTAPSTDAAKQWDGWGTALKPALEPITLARKPLIGTVAENVLAHGTGGLNIDGCRVGESGGTQKVAVEQSRESVSAYGKGLNGGAVGSLGAGRWPANLIHDGSDEVLAAFPNAPDSAARFFYCAKASRKDRNDGVGSSDEKAVNTNATMRQNEDADWAKRNGNHHPTVKPTDLMAYLCRLVTPPGGVVLDPFAGSGSTGKAALREGFEFVGIERELEYWLIAHARLSAIDSLVKSELP